MNGWKIGKPVCALALVPALLWHAPGFAEDAAAEAVAEAPQAEVPMAEAFAKEVEKLRKRAEQLALMTQAVSREREQSREQYFEVSGAYSELVRLESEQRAKFQGAWDVVRKLRIDRAAEAEVSAAVEQAKVIGADYLPASERRRSRMEELREKREALSERNDELSTAYSDARRAQSQADQLVSLAESALRRAGSEGWYERYLETLASREAAHAASEAELAERERKKAAKQRELAEWQARLEAMTPAEREAEAARLEADVAELEARRVKTNAQRDELREQSSLVRDTRSAVTDEMRSVSAEIRGAWDAFRQLQKDGAEPERLADARAQAEAKQQVLNQQLDNLKEEYEQLSEQLDALSKAGGALTSRSSDLGKRVYEINARARDVKAAAEGRTAVDPIEKRDARREAWALVKDQEFAWGENPFTGEAFQMSGGIMNGNARFILTHDNAEYHTLFVVNNTERSMHVLDADGRPIFSGPASNAADLSGVSQELYYLWEFLDMKVDLGGNFQ